jgi:hypothetical protein
MSIGDEMTRIPRQNPERYPTEYILLGYGINIDDWKMVLPENILRFQEFGAF